MTALKEPTPRDPQQPAWDDKGLLYAPEAPPEKSHPNWFATSPTGWKVSDRFDRVLPPHRKYARLNRKWFLIALTAAILFILGVVLGLAIGLTARSRHHNLPLPGGAKQYSGDMTYYAPGLGACGVNSGDNDNIVSISHFTFDAAQKGSDPNSNPLCKKKIRAQRVFNGKTKSVDLTVVDRCTGCQPNDLDVSPGVFSKLADPDQGRVVITWAWL